VQFKNVFFKLSEPTNGKRNVFFIVFPFFVVFLERAILSLLYLSFKWSQLKEQESDLQYRKHLSFLIDALFIVFLEKEVFSLLISCSHSTPRGTLQCAAVCCNVLCMDKHVTRLWGKFQVCPGIRTKKSFCATKFGFSVAVCCVV